MAEPQPSKLVMRVRFPSPAPTRNPSSAPRSAFIGYVYHPSSDCFVPHTCHTACRSPFILRSRGLRRWILVDLTDQAPEGTRDRLIPVPGRMLIDHRRACARMAQTRHQLLHARAGRGRESPANVTQVVEMQTRQSGLPACGSPGRPEVRASQRGTHRANEHKATIATASRSLPMVASHAIGYAEPRYSGHSQGIGGCG